MCLCPVVSQLPYESKQLCPPQVECSRDCLPERRSLTSLNTFPSYASAILPAGVDTDSETDPPSLVAGVKQI